MIKRPRHDKLHVGPKGYAAVGDNILGVIIHSTESDQRVGPEDRHGIARYLASKGLSVPLVIDDEFGTEMIPRPYCGFHCAGVTRAHGVEQIGRAGWSRRQWLEHIDTIKRTAHEAAWFLHHEMNLPVTPKNLRRFVIPHAKDHKFGGTSTHTDPGPNYPWDIFRTLAIAYAIDNGFRLVATKDDERRARSFRVSRRRKAAAWTIKMSKRGWRVIKGKKLRHGDLDD